MVFGIVAVIAVIVSAVICAVAGGFGSLAWLWMLPVGWLGVFLGIIVLVFILVLIMTALVDLDKEQQEDNKVYRKVMYLIADAAHTVLQVKVKSSGIEKIPTDGRVLLVCNHQNEGDPGILMHYFKKYELSFIAKKEVQDMFIMGGLMHKLVCQPINRENDREALKSILKCIQLLKTDEVSIGAFPEGGIFDKDKLHPFRSGVFKIAQRTQVPIVVCTLWGTQDVFHNGLRLKPTHVDFHVVGVVQPEAYKEMNTVQIGNLVHDMMAADLGPDKVLKVEETP